MLTTLLETFMASSYISPLLPLPTLTHNLVRKNTSANLMIYEFIYVMAPLLQGILRTIRKVQQIS